MNKNQILYDLEEQFKILKKNYLLLSSDAEIGDLYEILSKIRQLNNLKNPIRTSLEIKEYD